MNTDQAAEYIRLHRRKKEIEGELKRVKKDMEDLEQTVLDDMVKDGVGNMKIRDQMLYIHRQLWASPKAGETEQVCDALRELGHDDLVQERINTQSLSALVREWDDIGEPIPAVLEPHVNASEKFSLRVRKA